jgi:hypothetical protein
MPDDTAVSPNDPQIRFHLADRPEGAIADRYRKLIDICSDHIDIDRLHYVGHFVNGVATFSIDVLGSDVLAGYLSGGPAGPESLREALLALGRRFNYDMGQLDEELKRLRTGRLMRTILQVEHGGIFWYWIHENEYLVGQTLGGHTVDDADRSMAGIAEAILVHLRRPARNYGGFLRGITADDADPAPSAHAQERRSLRASRDIDGLAARCRDALDPRDLHYVSYFAGGLWQFSVDVLDDSPDTVDFGGLGSAQRRAHYERIGQNLQFSAGQLDRCLTTVTRHRPGRLVRTVLDVESGALYHHPLGPGHYLVGVTLFQARVRYADDRIRRLVDGLRADLGWPDLSEVV